MPSLADQIITTQIPPLTSMRNARQISQRAFFKHNDRVFIRLWVNQTEFELFSPSLHGYQRTLSIYRTTGVKAGSTVWTAKALADAIYQSAGNAEARFIAWPTDAFPTDRA